MHTPGPTASDDLREIDSAAAKITMKSDWRHYGYGIAVRIEQMSRGVFKVSTGSLFVAFQRLQRAGLIRGEWKASENNRRAKYYLLTDQGRKRLRSETREWERQVAAIARILEAS